MRTTWVLAFLAVAALPWQAAAQDKDSDVIIDKAIKAMGGDKVLTSIKAANMKAKGTVHAMEMEFEFTTESWSNVPDQTKVAITATIMNMNFEIIQIYNKGKGYASFAGQVKDLDADELKEFKDKIYVEEVTNLIALKDKTKGFKTSLIGDSKVGETAVVGVLVSAKDKRDVSLFFDKK